MNNIMLDIETMGNNNNASIMSIGACYFNPKTGEIGKTFHEQVSIETNGIMDASTVLWWMSQSDEARAKFENNGSAKHCRDVLIELSYFIDAGAQVWGNGAAFDNVIIRSAYNAWQLEVPWKFWNDRDVRKIVELGQMIGIDPKKDMPFEGVKHDALADAIHQAKYVSVIIKKLTIQGE